MNYENLYYMLILVMLGVGIWKTLENMKLRKDLHRERTIAFAYEQASDRLLYRVNYFRAKNNALRVENQELFDRLYKSLKKNKVIRQENYVLRKKVELVMVSETIALRDNFQVETGNPIYILPGKRNNDVLPSND